MARTKAKVPQFDWDEWEYVTYAPGHECSACSRTIKSLELVLRGTIDRTSGAPVTVYRYNECPSQAVAA